MLGPAVARVLLRWAVAAGGPVMSGGLMVLTVAAGPFSGCLGAGATASGELNSGTSAVTPIAARVSAVVWEVAGALNVFG